MAENKDRVAKYHEKLYDFRVRVPMADNETGIPDYPSMIRERAKELGFISTKGEGSANAYIISLIEKDLGIEIKSLRAMKKEVDK